MKTLSDKEKYYIKKGVPNYYYEEDDVKEFIKELKEYHCCKDEKCLNCFQLKKAINKLAGDKLI